MSEAFVRLAGNISFKVALVTGILFAGIAVFVSLNTSRMMTREAERTVTSVVKTTTGRIDRLMSDVESAVLNSAWIVGEHLDSPDYMYRITRELVQHNEFITGSAVAFEPSFFPSKGHFFAPYTCQTEEGKDLRSFQLGNDQNDYFTQEWYVEPLKRGEAYWCEPYFDTGGGGILMSTFSVPIKDAKGKVYAILTADLSLEQLTRHVAAIRPYPQSYAILTSAKGSPLVEPPRDAVRITGQGTITIRDNTENGWTVEVVCPIAQVLKGAQQLVVRIIVFSLVGLGLIFFLSWFFSSRLQRATAARERMESELNIASRIQSGMLPTNAHQDISSLIRSAREVGGDLYDYIEKDGKLYFIVGDASGKGVPASLFSFMTVTAFRIACGFGLPPAQIMGHVNSVLTRGNDMDMFVTAFVGVFDRAAGTLEFCNAGHNPPILVSSDGKLLPFSVNRNIPLGVMEDRVFSAQTVSVVKGSVLCVYTDGVTEAERTDHEQFGMERLSAFVAQAAPRGVSSFAVDLLAAVDAFTAGAGQFDDITILALQL